MIWSKLASNSAAKPGLSGLIPACAELPVNGDCARPEDGITHLRGFKTIHIHKDRCPHTAKEFKLYSWKTDRITGEILPIIFDKHNHCIDAIRCALDQFIQRRGAAGIWAKLGK